MIAQAQNWTKEEKCRELSHRLTGKTVSVLTQLMHANIPINFASLNEILEKQFAEKKTPAQLRSEFLAVKQGPEQSCYDYAKKVEELARACFGTQVSEEFIQFQMFEIFVKGLRDTDARILSCGTTRRRHLKLLYKLSLVALILKFRPRKFDSRKQLLRTRQPPMTCLLYTSPSPRD